jgi:hypothetical protein
MLEASRLIIILSLFISSLSLFFSHLPVTTFSFLFRLLFAQGVVPDYNDQVGHSP